MRLVAANADKFARVVTANTFLPTGDGEPSEAFLAWQKFSQETPVFDSGRIVKGAVTCRADPPRQFAHSGIRNGCAMLLRGRAPGHGRPPMNRDGAPVSCVEPQSTSRSAGHPHRPGDDSGAECSRLAFYGYSLAGCRLGVARTAHAESGASSSAGQLRFRSAPFYVSQNAWPLPLNDRRTFVRTSGQPPALRIPFALHYRN